MADVDIVFIGAGNLATHLAKALFANGFRVLQVYSRTEESARALAECVNSRWTTHLSEVLTTDALYIVSLKDDALLQLLPRIVAGRERSLLVHTAGSIPMSVWEQGATRYGVLYPLQTFSKSKEVDFGEIPFFIEANSAGDAELLATVARRLSSKLFFVDSEKRRSLHLSAVFACNFTNHLYALAAELLEKQGLPFDVLLPLIDETARKVHTLTPQEAQTGPAVRYDEQVIGKHLQLLEETPELQHIYQTLSQSIHALSLKSKDKP